MTELIAIYEKTVPDWIDKEGIYPAPALALKADGKLDIIAYAVEGPDIIPVTFKRCKDQEVVEQIIALDTFTAPGQGTELDSCLIVFHLRRGQPCRVGVLEYSWNGGQPVTRPINWDNEFWNRSYSRLAGEFTKRFR